jgi:hypothetical protein
MLTQRRKTTVRTRIVQRIGRLDRRIRDDVKRLQSLLAEEKELKRALRLLSEK